MPHVPFDSLLKRARYRRRMRARRRELADLPEGDAPPIELQLDVDSPLLLVAFGGLDRRIGMPVFEFMRMTGELPVKRAFIRDPRRSWYHRGLPGHGETLGDTRAAVEGVVAAAEGVQRTVFVGASAGGYAALLFAGLVGADVALAFSPQTTIDLHALHELGDHRWDDHVRPLAKAGLMDSRWVDLRGHLPRGSDYRVYVDDTLAVDRLHAERLAQEARLYRFGAGGHALVRHLRDRDALTKVLLAALDPSGEWHAAGAPDAASESA